MRLARALSLGFALNCATEGMAQPGLPGPDYFRGLYERVGRDVDDRVMIVPQGRALRLSACQGSDVVLAFDPYGARENAMVASTDGVHLDCLFHIDGSGHPILTCRSEGAARFTLWPVEPGFRTAPFDCG